MKSCSKCLTKETADTISFDENGVCGPCVQVAKKFTGVIDWTERRAKLDALVAQAKSRNDQYDCIIPYSGGKDSTFQAWFVVKELKMRPLLVRYNHWNFRPTVEKNNVRTFKALGVDFLDFRVNWQVVRAMMLEALIRRGDQCLHCHEGCSALPVQIALKFKIPLLIYGESLAEYQSFGYKMDGFEEWDRERYHRAMSQGIAPSDMLEFIKDQGFDKRDLAPFEFPHQEEIDALGLRAICLGNYIQWDTRKQVEIIKRELGWEGDTVEGVPPEWDYEKIECWQQGVRDYLKYIKRGFGRTNHLANIDIRHGLMTREDGAVLAAAYDGKEPASLQYFCDYIGITRAEFYEIAMRHQVDPWVFTPPS